MSPLAVLFLLIVAPALALCLALIGLETLGDNILGWFLLVFGVAYPVGGVIYYFIRHEPFWKSADGGKTSREEKKDNSFWAILPGFLVVFFASPLEWMYLPALLSRASWLQVTGLILIMAAVALRIWTRTHIRGLYSGHVEVLSTHRLVQSGPYRTIRHPGYTGLVLMATGLAVGYSSLIGLLAVPLLIFPGLAYRMMIEERLLREKFGEEYIAYQRRTKRLFPFLW
ncbi:MAG: isoprenylcysteine carboxylmethyltransferase family protein [Anaerolineaceae bacterium]